MSQMNNELPSRQITIRISTAVNKKNGRYITLNLKITQIAWGGILSMQISYNSLEL